MSTALAHAPRAPHSKTPRRPVPPMLDGPQVLRASTLMVVDGDTRRRERTLRALDGIPAVVCVADSFERAELESQKTPVAAYLLEGRDDPHESVAFMRRVRAVQPLAVCILVGIEASVEATLAAINEIEAYRVLTMHASASEIRAAALGALAHEQDRAMRAHLDRPWVRELVARIRRTVPAGVLARVDEKGGGLPFDLILRHDAAAE